MKEFRSYLEFDSYTSTVLLDYVEIVISIQALVRFILTQEEFERFMGYLFQSYS